MAKVFVFRYNRIAHDIVVMKRRSMYYPEVEKEAMGVL
jgi:hypothetical protein